ncbi:hypothetical protein NDU88_001467 [Pleurodeles waltl]|uniref:Uncharacterized protein n=1 Tax=Pleurodeles waltl TaxID=8319 RepID=A0AAV7WM90_PLEWA|nr:hypothetical protein NDU88_001467 [Pleurodeles waltl]
MRRENAGREHTRAHVATCTLAGAATSTKEPRDPAKGQYNRATSAPNSPPCARQSRSAPSTSRVFALLERRSTPLQLQRRALSASGRLQCPGRPLVVHTRQSAFSPTLGVLIGRIYTPGLLLHPPLPFRQRGFPPGFGD